MSFRTKLRLAGIGALFYVLGAPLTAVTMLKHGEISVDYPGLLKLALLPIFGVCAVSLILWPVLGPWSFVLAISLAALVGAAIGGCLFDLTEPAPLGTPGNPYPMVGGVPDIVLTMTEAPAGTPMVFHVAKTRAGGAQRSPVVIDLKTASGVLWAAEQRTIAPGDEG